MDTVAQSQSLSRPINSQRFPLEEPAHLHRIVDVIFFEDSYYVYAEVTERYLREGHSITDRRIGEYTAEEFMGAFGSPEFMEVLRKLEAAQMIEKLRKRSVVFRWVFTCFCWLYLRQ